MWRKYRTEKDRYDLSSKLFMKDFEKLSGLEAQKFRGEVVDSILLKKYMNEHDKRFLKKIGVEVLKINKNITLSEAKEWNKKGYSVYYGVIYKNAFPWNPYPSKADKYTLSKVFAKCREIEKKHFGSYNKYLLRGIFLREPNLIKFTSKKQERAVLEEFRILVEESEVFSLTTLSYKWVKYTNTSRTQDKIYRSISGK